MVKAVSNGLNPEEIVRRLDRHSSKKVPANVLRQVKDWSSWVRRVTSSSRTLLRCRTGDTADRVMVAIKSQAERVSDTIVAYGPTTLSEADRSNSGAAESSSNENLTHPTMSHRTSTSCLADGGGEQL